MSLNLTGSCRLRWASNLTIDQDNDIRQCLLYDSADAGARLIGIEYMITPELYESLPSEERRLWHSHVYEVKSGMLVMPNRLVPSVAWDAAEKREMEQVITLYGKVYHLWQTDKGHKVPLGEPKLMTSYIADGQLDFKKVEERDERFGTDHKKKMEARRDIPSPSIHPGKFIRAYYLTCYYSHLSDRVEQMPTVLGPGHEMSYSQRVASRMPLSTGHYALRYRAGYEML